MTEFRQHQLVVINKEKCPREYHERIGTAPRKIELIDRNITVVHHEECMSDHCTGMCNGGQTKETVTLRLSGLSGIFFAANWFLPDD